MSIVAPEIQELTHVRPLGDAVVVLAIKEDTALEQTSSGIWIDVRSSAGGVSLSDTVENEPIEGRIVALGSGVRHELPTWLAEKMADEINSHDRNPADLRDFYLSMITRVAAKPHLFSVKVGDRVLWTPWAAFSITLEGVEYHVITEDDIVGIVSE